MILQTGGTAAGEISTKSRSSSSARRSASCGDMTPSISPEDEISLISFARISPLMRLWFLLLIFLHLTEKNNGSPITSDPFVFSSMTPRPRGKVAESDEKTDKKLWSRTGTFSARREGSLLLDFHNHTIIYPFCQSFFGIFLHRSAIFFLANGRFSRIQESVTVE